MKNALVAGMIVLLCGLSVEDAHGQGAMVRGRVVDEEGRPLPDVEVEIQFTGEEPETFQRTTNEKGGWIQVGLPSGPYTINFSKEGYGRAVYKTDLSAGGLSEVPTVTLKAAREVVAGAEEASTMGEEIQETFARAMEATRAGRLDEGEALYEEILEKAPNLAEVHFNLGVLYRKKEDWAAAEAEFKKVIELQPDKSDTYSALAAVYDATGRSDEALDVLAGAGLRFQEDALFQFNLGVTCLNAGQTAQAAAAFRRARELDSSRVEALFYLGTLAIGGGDVEEAVGHLETYVSLSGQNPQNLETAEQLLVTLKTAQQ
jgi:tetratricopeptide (TPR) repeat protein